MDLERREVHFSGRVQGVGFRYTTHQIARRHEVAGFVRNLPDGRVHLIAEGAPFELDRFFAEISETMSGNIVDVETRREPYRNEFEDFQIVR